MPPFSGNRWISLGEDFQCKHGQVAYKNTTTEEEASVRHLIVQVRRRVVLCGHKVE